VPGSSLASTNGPEPIGFFGLNPWGTIDIVGEVKASTKSTVGYFSSNFTVRELIAVIPLRLMNGIELAGGSGSFGSRIRLIV
jgi:hypothetical protein